MTREMLVVAGVLCFCAGVIGYVLGQRAAMPLDETQVIGRWAGHYVQTRGDGAAETDCVATVGVEPGWMRVICTPAKAGAAAIVYEIGADGEILRETGEEALGI